MKKKFLLLLSAFLLFVAPLPVCAKQNEETSLSKVESVFSERFEDIDIAETETKNGKILFLAAGESETVSDLGKTIGDIWDESWFDYDYIFTVLFIDDVPLVTNLFDVSTKDITYHTWYTDDLTLKKEDQNNSGETSHDIVLTSGEYIIGKHIDPGLYNTFAEEYSSCTIYDMDGNLKDIVNTYNNLTLSEGDKLKITGSISFSRIS